VLESEQRVKSMPIRMYAYRVLCMAVKHHGHAYGEWAREQQASKRRVCVCVCVYVFVCADH